MKVIKFFQVLLFALFLFTSQIFGATGEADGTLENVIKIMVAVTAFLVAFVLWLVLVYSERGDVEGATFIDPIKKFINLLTKSTPVSKEKEILLAHEYDGIRELDNKIPPWFAFLFYGTIVFSLIYMINYHIAGSGNIQEEEFLEEIKQAAIERQILSTAGALIDEETAKFVNDVASLASGKEIFIKNCAACHGQLGEGLVGPNFTDDNWIHGGGIKNVFKTIKYGVPAKGMISWQTQLNPTQIQEVGSYILTLRGTNPPNQKIPEGPIWKDDAPSDSTAVTDSVKAI